MYANICCNLKKFWVGKHFVWDPGFARIFIEKFTTKVVVPDVV